MVSVKIRELLEAGVHFGHQTRRWNPKMKKYIFEARNKIYIIDLYKTAENAKKAFEFIRNTVADGKTVLFVGTKKQAKESIVEAAKQSNMFYVSERWLGGTLTNNQTIKQSINRLHELEKMEDDGIIDLLSKKEASALRREKTKLHKYLDGIKGMEKLPGVLFVVDTRKEKIAIAEANKLKIPVVALVDTNCNPDKIDVVIPGNDDAMRGIKLFATKIAQAAVEGSSIGAQRMEEKKKKEAAEKKEAEKKAAEKKAAKAAEKKTEVKKAAPKKDEKKATEKKSAPKADAKKAAPKKDEKKSSEKKSAPKAAAEQKEGKK